MVHIPSLHSPEPTAALAELARREPRWAGWVARVGRLAAQLCREWELEVVGEPLDAQYALVLPVRSDHGAAVLKLALPDEDGAGELPALKAWDGAGAVRVHRADPHRRAMLLERTSAQDAHTLPARQACELIGGLYGRLHVPAPPRLPALAESVGRWLDALAELGTQVPAPPRMVARAVERGRALLASDGEPRVVHGDLHYANVLRAEREPWLVIDPKGYAGDPGFEIAPLLWNRWEEVRAGGKPPFVVRDRFWTVIDAAGWEEARARDWVVVRAMIHAVWEVQDARAAGRDLDEVARERITRYVTVAKAMDEVGGW